MENNNDRLMDLRALLHHQSIRDCRKLEAENKELKALILEQDKEWEAQRLEIQRLKQVLIDEDNRIA